MRKTWYFAPKEYISSQSTSWSLTWVKVSMFISIHVHSCFHFITYICEQYISAHKSDSSRPGEVRVCPCWWLERLPLQGGYCVFLVVHAKVSIHIASQWRVPTKKLGIGISAQKKWRGYFCIITERKSDQNNTIWIKSNVERN